jgi:5-methylcytosine-specific restriction enzyme subunit McrC
VRVELCEWETVHASSPSHPNALTGLYLDDPSVQADIARIDLRDRLRVVDGRHGLSIISRQHVGVVRLGPLHISIRPKMAVSRLWAVVTYALGLDAIPRSAPVSLDLSGDFTDLLCEVIGLEADRLWRLGVARNYEQKHQWLASPRGRLDVRAFARSGPLVRAELPCSYHHFSADNIHNQLVLAVLRCATALCTSVRLRASLARSAQQWSTVTTPRSLDVRLVSDAQRASSRLTERYAAMARLAGVLLEGGGSGDTPQAGSHAVQGFLWNMAGVFEAFVGRFLREHSTTVDVLTQHRLTSVYTVLRPGPKLKSAPVPRPDLVAFDLDSRRPVAVLDTKYRDLWANSISPGILYQLSTYALAYDGPTSAVPAVVLYPAAEGVHDDMVLGLNVAAGEQRRIVFRSVDWCAAAAALQVVQGCRELARRWVGVSADRAAPTIGLRSEQRTHLGQDMG